MSLSVAVAVVVVVVIVVAAAAVVVVAAVVQRLAVQRLAVLSANRQSRRHKVQTRLTCSQLGKVFC